MGTVSRAATGVKMQSNGQALLGDHLYTQAVFWTRTGGVTPIGAVSRAATGIKIFDRLKMALTA